MRGQWGLIVGIIIVVIIAVFSVVNVDPVEVDYIVGTGDWPLVLVILVSVLMGGLIVGSVGMYRIFRLQQEIKKLKKAQQAAPAENTEETADDNDRETPKRTKSKE
ncbi:LapA family protein [Salisediminibacterium halotolerans]|uniref:LapA family protein n=1 Tax=Salisediminibacterium halotolerans TaxID=517425 RepID=UPI000EADDC81|nr:lipopolysaccharide assembly protein LapA domain-containing protein [Salisediminibacterium halotolerans]RLJ78382.1 putative integral membrane protein [Actinophytocola xinjiangensis]RPE88276.1 putative integral membrane protein [Salisediminibacterium halotolerans]TWG37358.1 putative integral membrane protein [Salisediminibacterium halotolerans]GEL06823.1 hypothetical protein SHA02_02390 [Salisediminibacterium halotolerans]